MRWDWCLSAKGTRPKGQGTPLSLGYSYAPDAVWGPQGSLWEWVFQLRVEGEAAVSQPGGKGDVQAGQDQLWGAAGFLIGTECTAWSRGRGGGEWAGSLHKNCGFCLKEGNKEGI